MKRAIRKIVMMAGKVINGRGSLFTPKSEVIKPSEDYLSDKLGFNTKKLKIKLNDFQGQYFMITIQDSIPFCAKFSETWNFQLCDEKTVRIQESECSQFANNGALWIYTKQKVEAASHGEGGQTITTYFLAEVEVEMEMFLN